MTTVTVREIGPEDVPPKPVWHWVCLEPACISAKTTLQWDHDTETGCAGAASDHVAKTRHRVRLERVDHAGA